MPQRCDRIDEVFKALADPTRRHVVELLVSGPTATSVLAAEFDMALPSFAQHLSVLEQAGVVASTKRGRVRTYHLSRAGLDVADDWLADQRRLWVQRLDQLDSFLTANPSANPSANQTDDLPDHPSSDKETS